jgi:hypothetical protein
LAQVAMQSQAQVVRFRDLHHHLPRRLGLLLSLRRYHLGL